MGRKNVIGKTMSKKVLKNAAFLHLMCLLSYMIVGANTNNAADVVGGIRTVKIVVDALEFDPNFIDVRAGETIRFVINNRGKVAHDLTIGTPAEQEARRALIRVLSDADELDLDGKTTHSHDHLNAVIVPPGQKRELIWTFKWTRSIEFGCNIPLHYEGGMRGQFNFSKPVAVLVVDQTPVAAILPSPLDIRSRQAKEKTREQRVQQEGQTLGERTLSVCFKPQIKRAIDSKCYDLTLKEIAKLLTF